MKAKKTLANVAAAVSLFLSAAHAVDAPVSAYAGADFFATLDDAARAALADAGKLAARFEHGGALLVCEGVFTYTAPATAGKRFGVHFNVVGPANCKLAGLYHTHPAVSPLPDHFTRADVNTAKRLQVRSYIGLQDGTVRVFDPGKSYPMRDTRGVYRDALTVGEEV